MMVAESRLKPGEHFLRDSCAMRDSPTSPSKLFAVASVNKS
jgi:hypothetical protein